MRKSKSQNDHLKNENQKILGHTFLYEKTLAPRAHVLHFCSSRQKCRRRKRQGCRRRWLCLRIRRAAKLRRLRPASARMASDSAILCCFLHLVLQSRCMVEVVERCPRVRELPICRSERRVDVQSRFGGWDHWPRERLPCTHETILYVEIGCSSPLGTLKRHVEAPPTLLKVCSKIAINTVTSAPNLCRICFVRERHVLCRNSLHPMHLSRKVPSSIEKIGLQPRLNRWWMRA